MIPVAIALAAAAGSGEARYVDASLELEARILSVRFVDVDADGREELCLAVRDADGSRELRFHRMEAARIEPEPFRRVTVLDDALAYGFADVRDEPGRELFFLARGGAWSVSLQREGLRGNIERLLAADLLYDVPDPRALPAWPYVFPADGGDWILLPERDGYAAWTPAEAGGEALEAAAPYRAGAAFSANARQEDEPRGSGRGAARTEVSLGRGGMRVVHTDSSLPTPFVSEHAPAGGALLRNARAYGAPAVLDLDGDGAVDLVTWADDRLQVYAGGPGGGVASEPTRVEARPAYLSDGDADLRFVDLDGDGDLDLLARKEDDDESDSSDLENGEVSLYVLLNDGARLFPAQPDQILRFEAAELRARVTDVDGDGRPDLAIRKFELPSLIGAVTGLEFKLTHLLFRGQADGPPFERKPALDQTETYDENSIQGAIKNRALVLDCDGDGIADLVEIDLAGRIAIRRLRREKSFFGGASWSVERTPWVRFDAFGDIESVDVRDLNDDGLGDIVSRGERSLTVLLSAAEGGRR